MGDSAGQVRWRDYSLEQQVSLVDEVFEIGKETNLG